MIRYLRDRSYRAKPQRPANGASQSGAQKHQLTNRSAPWLQNCLSNISQKFRRPALLMLRVPEAVAVSQVDQILTTLK
jgi:hypothetical protein